eukprot:COSAG02_NODE_5929_length_3935_cov_4.714286_3_plen_114_part_00
MSPRPKALPLPAYLHDIHVSSCLLLLTTTCTYGDGMALAYKILHVQRSVRSHRSPRHVRRLVLSVRFLTSRIWSTLRMVDSRCNETSVLLIHQITVDYYDTPRAFSSLRQTPL